MAAKFEIIGSEELGDVRWQLKAGNGVVIAESPICYTEIRKVERAVESVQNALADPDLHIVDLAEEA